MKNILLEDILNYAQYYKAIQEEELSSNNNNNNLVMSPPPPPLLHQFDKYCCVSYDSFTEKHRPDKSASPIYQLENPDRTISIIKHLSDINLLSKLLFIHSYSNFYFIILYLLIVLFFK